MKACWVLPYVITCQSLTPAVLVIRWKKTRAYKVFEPACPGFVGVAAYVHAHSDQRRSRFHNTDIEIDVEDQVRNLLHSASNRKLSTELFRKIGVTAATCLKARLTCLRPDRSNVDNFKFARACYERAQLITEPRQAGCFIRPLAIRRPLQDSCQLIQNRKRQRGGRAIAQR